VNKKIEILRKLDVFRDIDESELQTVFEQGTFVRYKNREVILTEDSPVRHVYFAVKGRVMIYKTSDDGKVKSLAIVQEGELFGEMAIISPGARCASAKALGPVKVLRLEAEHFKRLLKDNPSTAMAVLASLCSRLRNTNNHIEVLFYQSVPKRTVKALVMLASSGNAQKHNRRRLVLTQQELAELVGSAREVVNRTLQILKKEGLLILKKGAIEIPNLKKLKECKVN